MHHPCLVHCLHPTQLSCPLGLFPLCFVFRWLTASCTVTGARDTCTVPVAWLEGLNFCNGQEPTHCAWGMLMTVRHPDCAPQKKTSSGHRGDRGESSPQSPVREMLFRNSRRELISNTETVSAQKVQVQGMRVCT
jgi:hypothetical protein